MAWLQNYDPLHAWPLSTLASALPVITLFVALLAFETRVWVAALSGLSIAVALAWVVFRMPPMMIGAAAGLGVIFGLLRIAWIVVASIFLYHVTVETGQFQVMKESIAALSADKRLQLVLIAFCFGAFLEGTGGGGAPVAIAGSFLIGLGFEPFQAATLCLLANTAPVAWGAVGTPMRVLAGVTGLSEAALSAMTGRILPPISAMLPLWLVRSMVGWRETLEIWPALVVSGGSFALVQFYWSNWQDSGLVDIVAALTALMAMVGLLKVWRPVGSRQTLHTTITAQLQSIPGCSPQSTLRNLPTLAVFKAWSPFVLASVFIFLQALPPVSRNLTFSVLKQPMPGLHRAVLRIPPVVSEPTPEEAIADLNAAALPGTAVFLAAIVAAVFLGMTPAQVGAPSSALWSSWSLHW